MESPCHRCFGHNPGAGALHRPRTTDAAAAAAADYDDETEEAVARFSCRHQNTEKTRHCLLHGKAPNVPLD